MKTGLFLSFLASALLSGVQSDCDLTGGKFDVPFPDILKYVADSYILGVEYTVPGASQTDYYTEYYENEFKRGRLDGHQGGKRFKYVYRAETFEAWNIGDNKCERVNVTETPEFFKDDMTEWVHSNGEQFTTVGPSAMFKVAFDKWKTESKDKTKKTMAYMGYVNSTVRGEKAVFFRRCLDASNSYVDYFFAAEEEENALDMDKFDKKVTPIRVSYNNLAGKEPEMANQVYDIISFRHEIPPGVDPFLLPKGMNCTRDPQVDGPKIPDFSTNNVLISAEVLYRKISTKDGELSASYYSTFMLAIDRQINHMAYQFSSWNTTKPDKDNQKPFVNAPKNIVYDMTRKYAYTLNYEKNRCTISRGDSFSPNFTLPGDDGISIPLTDPYVLFPNNEFYFFTKATDRGLTVNIFEVAVENYPFYGEPIKKMYASRSYLTDNEEIENTVSVRNSLVQVELHLFRKPDTEEILTFNIFGFTTKLPKRRVLFDITRCFKNEDDYLYLTLGFEPEPSYMPQLTKKLTEVEEKVMEEITRNSELNAVRVPYVVTDVQKNFILITLLILGKPPLILDFPITETGKTVVANQDDIQGVSTFDVCANNCIETKSGCWGFSMCGNTCYYGTIDSTEVKSKDDCILYKRGQYINDSSIQSKDVQANNIVSRVESGEFKTTITLESGDKVELKATIAHITDPAEDDNLFEKMGNLLNPRMRVFKAASKLHKGSTIKNLGRLRYDECQKLCLDFKDCETLSYCLIDSECKISSKYATDLKPDELEDNNLCNLLTRKYADHFDRTPGVFASRSGGTTVEASSVEDCAMQCLKQTAFKCLSFDHCAGGERLGCHLYTDHFLNTGSPKPAEGKSPRCGHYSRKYSVEFQKKADTRIVGGSFLTILNLTLEECAQRCVEEGGGACYGYDFCQDVDLTATSCTLIDSDPSRLKTAYSSICTNYGRTGPEYAPRPYTTGYAGGIGFLCFLIGGVVGAVIVFGIAYIKVNKR